MTYLEIIEWIEQHLSYFEMHEDTLFKMSYIDDEGYTIYHFGKDLISIVLEINGKELVK